jgi:hypothetical protein
MKGGYLRLCIRRIDDLPTRAQFYPFSGDARSGSSLSVTIMKRQIGDPAAGQQSMPHHTIEIAANLLLGRKFK